MINLRDLHRNPYFAFKLLLLIKKYAICLLKICFRVYFMPFIRIIRKGKHNIVKEKIWRFCGESRYRLLKSGDILEIFD